MLRKNLHMVITLSVLVLCTFYLRQPHETDFLPGQTSLKRPVQRNLQDTVDVIGATLCKNFAGAGTFTEAQIAYAQRCKQSLNNFRNGNRMLEIVQAQSPVPDTEADDLAIAHRNEAARQYAKTLLSIEIILGVLFFFTFVCYWGFFLNFFAFGKQICFCFNWGDNTNVKVKWVYGLFTLLFIASLVGVGIAGLGVSSQVEESANGAICTLHASFQEIVNGNSSRNWLGLNRTYLALTALLDDLTVVQLDLTTLSAAHDNFTQSYDGINNTINVTYTNHKDFTLPRPDNTSQPTYVPQYIQDFGPVDTQGQTTNYIQIEVTNAAAGISNDYDAVHNNIAAISAENDLWAKTDKGRNLTWNATVAATSLMLISNDYSQQISDTTQEAESILHTIFQSLCLIPIFCIFWWFLTYILKARIFICLSLGWILLSILGLTAWIISLILVPSNITLMETCGVIQAALNDTTTFNQTINLFSTKAASVIEYLGPCIFEEHPSIPRILGMDNALNVFNSTYTEARDSANKMAIRPNVSTDFASSGYSTKYDMMTSYASFNAVDNSVITTDIQTVNTFSNNNTYTAATSTTGSECESMQDAWVFNSSSCTNATYKNATDKNAGYTTLGAGDLDYFNVGHKTCIGVDNWYLGVNDTSNGTKFIQDRYDVLRYLMDCQHEDQTQNTNETTRIVEGFVSNRRQLRNSISTIQGELDTLTNSNYSDFINHRNPLSVFALNLNTSMTELYSTLYDPSTGLTNNLQCSLVRKALEDFSTNMCVGLIPIIFQLTILSVLMSIFASCGACSMFCFARRMRSYGLAEEIVDEAKVKLNEPKPVEVQMATRVY